jgi:DHA1 family tetracycline resistance protein-like MFS transporter
MFKTKALILLTVFIDVVGVGVVIPILPFYVAKFSTSPLLVTSLFAIFALCSFFSAPVIGAVSDKIGRRPMLIMSIFSTAIGWFIFASAFNIFLLFLGRIIDGVMAGNFPIAQSYLSDLAKDDKERTTNLGSIGAVFGLGFIFGPLIGGLLGQFGHAIPFWFVGFLALFNAVLAFFILPETHSKSQSKEKISINPFTPIIRAIKDTQLQGNYLASFLVGVAIAGPQAIFALYLHDIFHFNELEAGIIFGIIGVIIVVNQTFFMRHVWLKFFKEPILELGMLVVYFFGFLLQSTGIFPIFCVALLLTTFGQSTLRPVMTSQVVGIAGGDRRGEVLGIMASVMNLSMTISPFIAGIEYGINPALPFLFSALVLVGSFVLLFSKRNQLANIKVQDTEGFIL